MADKIPRATVSSRVVSSRYPEDGAQIVIDKSLALATQDGSGIILDKDVIELQSSRIKLSASELVEIQGVPFNNELITSIINSKEAADISRMNRFAGEVIPGVAEPHSHLFPSIYVPSTYKSGILHQLEVAKETISALTDMVKPLLDNTESPVIDLIGGNTTTNLLEDQFADPNNLQTGRSDEFGPLNSSVEGAPMMAL